MQRNYDLEILIDGSIDFLCELLDIKRISWDFVKFEKNTSKYLKDNFTAIFNFDEMCIYINPYLEKNLKKEIKNEDANFIKCVIISKLAHECRHAYHLEHQDEFNFKQYYNDLKNKKDVINSDVEIDAYAFEQAILWLVLDDKDLKIYFGDSIQDRVQELALKLYNKYFIKYNIWRSGCQYN